MYIPIWVIVIVVIIFFIYLSNKEKSKQTTATSIEQAEDPSLVKIGKHWQHEEDVNTFFDLNTFDELFKNHENKIINLKDNPNKVRQERVDFDNFLRFSQRLWQFVDDVKYYPNWYKNSKNKDGTRFWKSKTIKPEELLLKPFASSGLKKLVDKTEKFSDTDEIIEYTFKIDGNKYTLFINKAISRQTNLPSTGEDWEPIYYYPVFVFENGKKLVYQSNLYYESGEYADSYDHYDLEAFKPGYWTKFLLGIIFNIRKEEEQSSKEFRENLNESIKNKNKNNFL